MNWRYRYGIVPRYVTLALARTSGIVVGQPAIRISSESGHLLAEGGAHGIDGGFGPDDMLICS